MRKNRQIHFKLARTILVAGAILLSGLSVPASSAEQTKKAERECQLISSQSAVKKAQKMTGGKVVSIKLNKAGTRSVYKVRVLVEEKRIKNISIKACK